MLRTGTYAIAYMRARGNIVTPLWYPAAHTSMLVPGHHANKGQYVFGVSWLAHARFMHVYLLVWNTLSVNDFAVLVLYLNSPCILN